MKCQTDEVYLKFQKSIQSLAVAPNGETLLVGCGNGSISLVDLVQKKTSEVIKYKKGVRCLAFCPSGERLVSGCDDGCVKMISLNKNEENILIKGNYKLLASNYLMSLVL